MYIAVLQFSGLQAEVLLVGSCNLPVLLMLLLMLLSAVVADVQVLSKAVRWIS